MQLKANCLLFDKYLYIIDNLSIFLCFTFNQHNLTEKIGQQKNCTLISYQQKKQQNCAINYVPVWGTCQKGYMRHFVTKMH